MNLFWLQRKRRGLRKKTGRALPCLLPPSSSFHVVARITNGYKWSKANYSIALKDKGSLLSSHWEPGGKSFDPGNQKHIGSLLLVLAPVDECVFVFINELHASKQRIFVKTAAGFRCSEADAPTVEAHWPDKNITRLVILPQWMAAAVWMATHATPCCWKQPRKVEDFTK